MLEQFSGFCPVVHGCDRILILGTMPSPASILQGFYYGHPQNRFWPMLARIFGAPIPRTLVEKQALLKENHLALWDVLSSCERKGAADATIRTEIPNEIAALLRENPSIQTIACNGAAAHALFLKHIATTISPDIAVHRLPSTSPANAACKPDALCAQWQKVLSGR